MADLPARTVLPPGAGRFLTPDAIVPDVLNGQAWNAYAYVYNDPINLVDPSGYQGGTTTRSVRLVRA
ncbi:MAG: hypothetical protein HC828_04305 [Blastochloris sp.]|nr:hypothetical protein [Blastochloris sp.]